MKKVKVLENLKSLFTELRSSDFAPFGEIRALDRVIRKMERKQADQEGSYTVFFAYPEELTDGKLQTCVEFVRASAVDEAILQSGRPEGSTIVAVFNGHRKCLYSEA